MNDERFDIDVGYRDPQDLVEAYITKDDQPAEDAGLEQRCKGAGEIEVGIRQDEFGNWDTETYECPGCQDCSAGVAPCDGSGHAYGYLCPGCPNCGAEAE